MNRRLSFQLLSTTVLTAASGSPRAQNLAPTPAQPEGPYYPVEPIPLRADLTRRGGQQVLGTLLALEGRISRAGQAVPDARVEIWQCDVKGYYRHPKSKGSVDGGWDGFGAQMTDAKGQFRFRTLLPVPYEERPPHVHFKVWVGGTLALTTQAYLEGQTRAGGPFGWQWALFSNTNGLTMTPIADAKGALSARFDITLG